MSTGGIFTTTPKPTTTTTTTPPPPRISCTHAQIDQVLDMPPEDEERYCNPQYKCASNGDYLVSVLLRPNPQNHPKKLKHNDFIHRSPVIC